MERSRAGKSSRKGDPGRAERALKKSEECYRAAIEHSNDGVAIIRDEVYVFVNQKFLEMFGYQTPEELLGRRVTDAAMHLPPADRERLSDMDRRRQKGEPAPSRYEFKGTRKDGTTLYVEASMASIVCQARPSLLAYLRDITERKQAELRLRDSEAAMKLLLNATTDLALLMDTKGFIIAVNDVVAERLGREAVALIGLNIFDLIPEDVACSRRPQAQKVMESGKSVRFEDASTDDRYFDSCIYPVLDDEGKVVRLAVYAKDVTEIKHTSHRLVESESTFRRLLDSVNDGIVVRDTKTFELLDANRRFCQMWGYTFAEMKALPLGSLGAHTSLNEHRERLIASYAQVANGAPGLVQFPARRKDGSTFWCELNVTRMTIGDQECLLSVARDITERREAEEAVKRGEEEALRLAQETSVIAEVGRIINSSVDIDEVYEHFAEEVRKLIPFDRIVVNLVNQAEGTLTTTV
jgi:PAS domain S-box-containing protein